MSMILRGNVFRWENRWSELGASRLEGARETRKDSSSASQAGYAILRLAEANP